MTRLSEVLTLRRKQLGLTLAQIADLMDVSEATVQRWESGSIKSIRYNKIGKLAEVLQVSPSILMGWEEDSPEELELSEGEKNFILLLRQIPEEHQRVISDMVRAYSDNLNKG